MQNKHKVVVEQLNRSNAVNFYRSSAERYPLGLHPKMILGMSKMLEDFVSEYMEQYPRKCRLSTASIGKGAMTFKIFSSKKRSDAK